MNCQHRDSPLIEETPIKVDIFLDSEGGLGGAGGDGSQANSSNVARSGQRIANMAITVTHCRDDGAATVHTGLPRVKFH